MTSLKESWKETGSDLGNAFKGLGKNIVRSVKTGVDKATDWAEGDDKEKPERPEPEIIEEQ